MNNTVTYGKPCCNDIKNWHDTSPAQIGGKQMIRTFCRVCQRWLGNRPVQDKAPAATRAK